MPDGRQSFMTASQLEINCTVQFLVRIAKGISLKLYPFF